MKSYKVMKMFVWNKRVWIVKKFFSELIWIWGVDIEYDGCCVVVSGVECDVVCVMCLIESMLLDNKKGGLKWN